MGGKTRGVSQGLFVAVGCRPAGGKEAIRRKVQLRTSGGGASWWWCLVLGGDGGGSCVARNSAPSGSWRCQLGHSLGSGQILLLLRWKPCSGPSPYFDGHRIVASPRETPLITIKPRTPRTPVHGRPATAAAATTTTTKHRRGKNKGAHHLLLWGWDRDRPSFSPNPPNRDSWFERSFFFVAQDHPI